MPYIAEEERKKLDPLIESLSDSLLENLDIGEYNYVITRLMHNYLIKVGLRYKNVSAAKAVLSDARDELNRIVMSPYEDAKIEVNGPVSDLDKHIKHFIK